MRLFLLDFVLGYIMLKMATPIGVMELGTISVQKRIVNPFVSVVVGSGQEFLKMTIMVALADTYCGHDSLNVKSLIKNAKQNTRSIVLAIVFIKMSVYVLSFVTIVGPLSVYVIEVATVFVVMVLHENLDMRASQGIVAGIKMTNGYKMNIFVLSLHYLWPQGFLAYIMTLVGVFIPNFDIPGMFLLTLGRFFTIPLFYSGLSIFYVKLKRLGEGKRLESSNPDSMRMII